MQAPPPSSEPRSEQPELDARISAPSTFWDSPRVQESATKLMDALPDFLTKKGEREAKNTAWAQVWVLAWTFFIVAAVVVPVAWLVYAGKVTSDSGTFLFGTVVGAAFTFLRDFFPTRD